MNYTLLRSFFTLLLIGTLLTSACKKKDGGSNGIGIELIEATTEFPAKVRLFFQVDMGEDQSFGTLNESNFQIFENNLQISELESQAKIQNEVGSYLFSSMILLDLSGSVLNGDALPRVKDATINYIQEVMPNTNEAKFGSKEMAVYWFDGEEKIHLLAPFSIDKFALIDSVRAITSAISNDNSTNLNGAIIQGISELEARITDRNQDPRLSTAGTLLLFSDGADQAGRATREDAIIATESLTNQYSIFTIGLGSDIDESFLRLIGKEGNEFALSSFDLNQVFLEMGRKVTKTMDSYIVLEYCSPKRSGDHNIELRVISENKVGKINTEFNAMGFTGGCIIQ